MPRKYGDFTEECAMFPKGFNEAGADAPEIQVTSDITVHVIGGASMRPGRMPRKYATLVILMMMSHLLQ